MIEKETSGDGGLKIHGRKNSEPAKDHADTRYAGTGYF